MQGHQLFAFLLKYLGSCVRLTPGFWDMIRNKRGESWNKEEDALKRSQEGHRWSCGQGSWRWRGARSSRQRTRPWSACHPCSWRERYDLCFLLFPVFVIFLIIFYTCLPFGTSRPSRLPCQQNQHPHLWWLCQRLLQLQSNVTDFYEESHHVEQLVDADGPVAVLVEEVEDPEQVVLGLAVAEEVEQHAHAVESWGWILQMIIMRSQDCPIVESWTSESLWAMRKNICAFAFVWIINIRAERKRLSGREN